MPLVILVASLPAPWSVETSAQSAPQTAAPAQAASTEARRAFDTKDWYKVKTVGAPAMSPDGKYVAVQVTSVNEAKNSRSNEIWVVSTAPDGGEPVRFSAPGFDSTNPRFTPDSTQVVFTSTRPGYSGTQWAVRVDRPGGEVPYTAASDGPARPRTRAAASSPAARADLAGPTLEPAQGQELYRLHRHRERRQARRGNGRRRWPRRSAARGRGADANDPYASMPPMARPPANAITLPLDPARFDGMQITDMRYKANGRGFVPSTGAPARARRRRRRGGGRGDIVPPEGQPPAQILVDRLDGAGRKPITATAYTPSQRDRVSRRQVDRLRRRQPSCAPTPSCARFATRSPSSAPTPSGRRRRASVLQADLFVMPVAGGTPRRIQTPGNEGSVEWSPDSRWITYSSSNGQGTNSHIYLADVTTARDKEPDDRTCARSRQRHLAAGR